MMNNLTLAFSIGITRWLLPVSIAVCILALFFPESDAQETKKPKDGSGLPKEGAPFPVSMEVVADKPENGKERICVILTIKERHVVYANSPGNEKFEHLRTTMSISGKNLADFKIIYPKGELVEDRIVGNHMIYTGRVTLEAWVKRCPLQTGPLLVTVRMRPYSEYGCFWKIASLTKEIP